MSAKINPFPVIFVSRPIKLHPFLENIVLLRINILLVAIKVNPFAIRLNQRLKMFR